MRPARFAISVLVVASVLVRQGCAPEHAAPEAIESGPTTTAIQGKVSATARMSTSQITIAQRVECAIRVTAPIDYVIEFPALAESLGDYTIVESSVSPPRLDPSGNMEHNVTLLLEPFLPGQYLLDPLIISYRTNESDEASVIELTLPVVTVVSVLDDSPESASIGELKSTLDPPESSVAEDRSWGVAAAIGIPIAALALAGIVFVIRKKRVTREPDLCLAAITELKTLASSTDLPDQAVDRVNGALRVCLAQSIEPLAVSLTTDQLIASSGVKHSLLPDDQASLRRCLQDLEYLQFAPQNEVNRADLALPETITQAARLAELLTQLRNESRVLPSNGHHGTTGGRA